MDNINLDLDFLNIKKFFLGANTPFGFISYFDKPDKFDKHKQDWYRFLIKGGPGTGKSMLMKSIVNKLKD